MTTAGAIAMGIVIGMLLERSLIWLERKCDGLSKRFIASMLGERT